MPLQDTNAGADTIAAVSTPSGEGGVGIIRISGPAAAAIAKRLFAPAGSGEFAPRSHELNYGYIVEPGTAEKVDEVLLALMLAPRTYTREDVVEINCHGGMVPLGRVLSLVLAEGARLAEPGEFTKRAFLSGRIDLSQAEAALDLIRAKSAVAESMAMRQLQGGLSARIEDLMERLKGLCAHMEAWIDFPEDEIEPAGLGELTRGMDSVAAEARELSATFDEGRLLKEGLKCVIAGRPNVGKSSLLNAMLRRERAIVTEMPGTTRDVIEEQLNIKGLPVVIMDTAGIRQAHDMAEAEGVKRSLNAVEDADLVLGVIDGSVPLAGGDRELLESLKGRRAIVVINKCDLPRVAKDFGGGGLEEVEVSAMDGSGLGALEEAILKISIGAPETMGEGLMVTNLRHKTALIEAAEGLGAASRVLRAGEPLEIAAIELRGALDSLGRIVGAVSSAEILDIIFGEFCIGK